MKDEESANATSEEVPKKSEEKTENADKATESTEKSTEIVEKSKEITENVEDKENSKENIPVVCGPGGITAPGGHHTMEFFEMCAALITQLAR